ncbi:MAG: DUF4292 domain-containing protein, partial [Sphingobacteriia bacterium]|nr:DUF4292 domain-containing protein [Sphingobacteriia bacterium]
MPNSLRTSALVLLITFAFSQSACKHRRKTSATPSDVSVIAEDTINVKCRLDFKSARTLSRNMKDNELQFTWLTAKANVTSLIEEKEENFDIRVSIRRDSAMLVSIQYLLGLQVAKV